MKIEMLAAVASAVDTLASDSNRTRALELQPYIVRLFLLGDCFCAFELCDQRLKRGRLPFRDRRPFEPVISP